MSLCYTIVGSIIHDNVPNQLPSGSSSVFTEVLNLPSGSSVDVIDLLDIIK